MLFFREGHSPNYQVCKLNHGVIDVTLQRNSIAHESFVKKSVSTIEGIPQWTNEKPTPDKHISKEAESDIDNSHHDPSLRLFLYGVSETNSRQVFKHLKMESEVEFTDNISEADAILALLSKIRKNSRIQAAAHSNDVPIYVIKTSSLTQLTKAIETLVTDYENGFEDSEHEHSQINETEKIDALEEVRIAVEQVVIPKSEPVELLPRPPGILLLQKDLIRKYKLQAQRIGSEVDERLRILPFQAEKQDKDDGEDKVDDDEVGELSKTNGSSYPMNRLPFLPD